MITISLCMIVKNEEMVLARCLDSIRDLVDEIIIVDTGSTDRTKEVARRYTKNVFDFEWVNDFSIARNFSFSKASMEYIYVADADEVLDEENRKRLFQLKEAMLPQVDIVQMYYCNLLQFGTSYNFDREYRPKMYKRLRQFEWMEAIHEAVRLEPVVFDSEIEILHMPANNHKGRDLAALLAVFRNGNRLSKRLHHMYAMELFISGEDEDFLEAEEVFADTVKDETRSVEEIKEAFMVLMRVYRLKDDVVLFFKTSLKDMASNPSSETCYELGEYFYQKEDYEEAILWFFNATHEVESSLYIRSSGDLPLRKLSLCYKKLGNEDKANEFEKLAKEKELNM